MTAELELMQMEKKKEPDMNHRLGELFRNAAGLFPPVVSDSSQREVGLCAGGVEGLSVGSS